MPESLEDKKVTLGMFIEDNHKLLATLGIFIALTVFAKNIPQKWASHVLSFLFLNATILIAIEILGRFPPEKTCKWMLWWFQHIIFFSMFSLAVYWIFAFPALLLRKEFIGLILFLSLFSLTWRVLKRSKAFNLLFPDKPKRLKTIRIILGFLAAGIYALILLFLSILISIPIKKGLDKVRERLETIEHFDIPDSTS